jgi:hypothetical protein
MSLAKGLKDRQSQWEWKKKMMGWMMISKHNSGSIKRGSRPNQPSKKKLRHL